MTVTDKKKHANRQNANKGGVKTEEGKRVSAMNSLKHGLLSTRVFEEEEVEFVNLLIELNRELSPTGALESILVERMAHHVVQLGRIAYAKSEFIKACEQPGKVEQFGDELFKGFDTVLEEPYEPKVRPEWVEKVYGLYHRYEVSTENRLYKAIAELKAMKLGFVW